MPVCCGLVVVAQSDPAQQPPAGRNRFQRINSDHLHPSNAMLFVTLYVCHQIWFADKGRKGREPSRAEEEVGGGITLFAERDRNN